MRDRIGVASERPLQRASWLALAAGLAAAGLAFLSSVPARIDAAVFDAQVKGQRRVHTRSAEGVVIVGIDEATIRALPVPFAMAHAELGAALEALARSGAALIVLDVILPDRSYDHLKPGLDLALFRGLRTARDAGLVVAIQAERGGVRTIFPPFVEAAGADAIAFAVFEQDVDGVVRRFEPKLGPAGDVVPTVAGRIGERLGLPVHGGWIDWSLGAPFEYLPLHEVAQAGRRSELGDLGARVRGKVVIIGSVEAHVDRLAQPVQLASWEAATATPPGVVVHAQAARTLLAGGMIRTVPWPATALALLATAGLAFVPWLGLRWALLIVAIAFSALLGAWALTRGWNLAWALAWIAGVVAVGVRTALDAWVHLRERQRLTQTFGGYVSPQVLRAILDGRIAPHGGRGELAFLFADLRGFTAMSEKNPPEQVLALLNRYFAAITPALHGHGGTIDNFRGDGVMVMFGAPEPLERPAAAAIRAARSVFEAVDRLNVELVREGKELALGIGVAHGAAVYGDLGSDDRKDFTALGDAVIIAARLQDLAKELGYPLVATAHALAAAALEPEFAAEFEPLGTHALKGHSPVEVCGWPRRLT
jgi:class 3 adenylate cyclase